MKKFLFILIFAFVGLFATASSTTKAVTNTAIELKSNMVLSETKSPVKENVKKFALYYLGVYDVYVDGVYIGTYHVFIEI